jgi:hypothetical protein
MLDRRLSYRHFLFLLVFLLIQCDQNVTRNSVAPTTLTSTEAPAPMTIVSPDTRSVYPPPSPLGYPAPAQPSPIIGHIRPTPIHVPLITLPTTPATDFAFSLRFGACGTDIIDTFAHTFTKDMLGSPAITIPVTLSSSDMLAIYQKMAAINLFGYPSRYDTMAYADETHAIRMPAMNYAFTVRNNGHITEIEWADIIVPPPSDEAKRLQELAELITSRVNTYPDIQRLPPPNGGCL